ncbi:flagellar protein FlgN [Vibrio sp. VPAP30]|uniref:flagellar protein FlgN n=1 Tax=Vibrio sp. VPAP30 TaxID=1647102 RepID=UPI00065A078D|nr:flagellar protein FlgN [Vibrio sp. VPAP30]KLN66184.1 LfgN [Vibrio sp. VPAP30]
MTSEASRLVQNFVRSVGEDIALYRKLAPLLQDQRMLYLTFDAEKLNQNINTQKPLIEKLNANAKMRSQVMDKLGLPLEQSSIEKIFNALPQSIAHKVRHQWQTLASLIEQCQQLNSDNGASSAAFHELISSLKEPSQHTYTELL